MKAFILIYILLLLSTEALMDGLAYRRKNVLTHLTKAALILIFLLMPLLVSAKMVPIFIIAYVSLRFALFNYLFNLFAGLHWSYLSPEVLPDKYLLRIPLFHLLFMQFIFLMLGVAVIFNEF